MYENTLTPLDEIYETIKLDWKRIAEDDSFISFNSFQEFIHAYTVGIEESYPLKNSSFEKFKPYILLLHFSVAYNHFLYERLTVLLKGNVMYPWISKDEKNDLTDLLFLQLIRQRNFILDDLVRSFCLGREFQSLQQLRGYIEVTQLIFLLLTDFESVNKFLNNDLNDEEYRKLWWKHLSPSKILKKLKTKKSEVEKEEIHNGFITLDVRKTEPGTYGFIEDILGVCNDYIHWKKDILFQHSFDKGKFGFRIQGKNDWSSHSNATLVSLIEVVNYSSVWIEDSLDTHVKLFNKYRSEKETKGEMLQFIHSVFTLRSTYSGLYEFKEGEFKF